jgi:hypothetical protein
MKYIKLFESIKYKESDYKEYDEYSILTNDIINNWKNDFENINKYFDEIKHDIHMYRHFLSNYVLFGKTSRGGNFNEENAPIIIIPNKIELTNDIYNKKTLLFEDSFTGNGIFLKNIISIKNMDEIVENYPNIFLKLYNLYIKRYKANYMDIFGKKEYQYLIKTQNYNI